MINPDQVLSLWSSSSCTFPEKLPIYSESDQRTREQYFEHFTEMMKSKTKQANGSPKANLKEKTEFVKALADFFRYTLDYSEDQLQTILSDRMVDSTWLFLKGARKYDPELTMEDSYQALRNVWILNGLQLLMGRPVMLTPSIFAYSMLYPYTDNYLDDASIPSIEKEAFGGRFARRLEGVQEIAKNRQEEKIFEMVELIEDEWSRELYPELYLSLLDIHAAQSDSIRLIDGVAELSFRERLEICIHKGGTSVVADGYLLAGKLFEKKEKFLYAYGAYLQLLDDLQDLSDDLAEGVLTAFAAAAMTEKLDSILNRTFHLGQLVIEQAEQMESDQVPVFKSLMQKSIELFLVEAVQSNNRFFTPGYVREFNKRSPLSFAFIEKKAGTFSPYQNQLFEKLIEQALSSETEEDFSFLPKKKAC